MNRAFFLCPLFAFAALTSCVMPPPMTGEPSMPLRRVPPAAVTNRPARNLEEIDQVAQRVARETGKPLSVYVNENPNPRSAMASMYHRAWGGRIVVNPRSARQVPLNSWAFIFGHEFAHHVHDFGHRGHTDPEQELRADILGAEYAIRAGYDLVPYLRWMLASSRSITRSHGSMHERAHAMARYFGVRGEL
jgi:hypothetical protein